MKTMVQHPENDYDIDDGAYFDANDLVGGRGAPLSARDARQMVRDAIDDGSFKTNPEVRRNCVRIYYEAGYHVDVAIYRTRSSTDIFGTPTNVHELAGPDWRRSDARDVTDWFDAQNQQKSPDTTNGRQLRRVVRYLKKFARSRASWTDRIAKGFTITVLASECYRPSTRDDIALYDTMSAIRSRLALNLEVGHPVTPNEMLTCGTDDPRSLFLREKLKEALATLAVLRQTGCTKTNALAAWDQAFAVTFFGARDTSESLLRAASAPALSFPDRPVTPRRPAGFG
jgi:hypothetical protein